MTDLELHPDLAPAPTTLFASASPAVIVQRATEIANAIAPLIRDRNLYTRISNRDHVQLEGWTLAGALVPTAVFPITVSSGPIYDTDGHILGYQATAEARTMTGNVVGRADAECTRDEAKWADKDSFQLRSMAQTRASSKALRMPLGFVMKLAGYETTPAEEMEAAAARGETVSGGRGVRLGWRDVQEQQREHARLGAKIDEHGLREWVATWMASKAYPPRPLAKAQFNQLERAISRELAERAEKSGGLSAATDTSGDAVSSSPPDPSPSAPEQEEAPASPEPARPGAEGANGRSGAVPPDDATAPPESTAAHPPGRRSSGGPKPAREESSKGKVASSRATSTDEDEQALFDKAKASDSPERFIGPQHTGRSRNRPPTSDLI